MSEAASEAAPEVPPEAAPILLHHGTYALYETPAGGRHLVYERAEARGDDGELHAVTGEGPGHLPDFPREALPLLSQFLDHGIPAPILAVLRGQASPAALLAQLRGGDGE